MLERQAGMERLFISFARLCFAMLLMENYDNSLKHD